MYFKSAITQLRGCTCKRIFEFCYYIKIFFNTILCFVWVIVSVRSALGPKWPTLLGVQRHCESKLSCPRTQHSDPSQRPNPRVQRSKPPARPYKPKTVSSRNFLEVRWSGHEKAVSHTFDSYNRRNKYQLMVESHLRDGTEPAIFVPKLLSNMAYPYCAVLAWQFLMG